MYHEKVLEHFPQKQSKATVYRWHYSLIHCQCSTAPGYSQMVYGAYNLTYRATALANFQQQAKDTLNSQREFTSLQDVVTEKGTTMGSVYFMKQVQQSLKQFLRSYFQTLHVKHIPSSTECACLRYSSLQNKCEHLHLFCEFVFQNIQD